ncbi:MAG: hypothetical protein QXW56_05820 [Nitrososphaerota archaeon]
MIPELTPNSVSATGAYQLATALAMLSLGVGAILRSLPSRKWKAEGRDLMRSAFEAVLLGSSLLTAEFILGYVNRFLGIPRWDQLLQTVYALRDAGWASLQATSVLAVIFGTVVGALDILSKVIPVIMTFVMHFFMAVAFSVLSFFASLSVLMVVLSNTVVLVAAMASGAYLLVAAGIALFGLRHTRALGISLLVFGIALFYGLPVILGFVQPAEPYAASSDEQVRASLLLSLTEASVPTRISVLSGGGKPLYFSYISMNSSVQLRNVPLNSSLVANLTGQSGEGIGNATYRFVYGRFYNESYPRDIRCTGSLDPQSDYVCVDYGPDYSRVKELRHQLYRDSTVRHVWYLGLMLPVRDNRVQVQGPSLAEPMIEIPSNPFEVAGSLQAAFGGLRSEEQYWDMVYGRSEPVRIEVPVVRELNRNVTAFVLYNETNYRSWRELEGRREYIHNYTIPRVSYHCWVSRTEEYFDPSCNCTRTRTYYRARAEYLYETPPDERLALVLIPGTSVIPGIVWHSEDGGPAHGKSEPVIYLSDPSYPLSKGLILGYGPLSLRFNQGIVQLRKIPEPTNEAANRIRGNPGEGSGTERELQEPELKEVTLDPEIEVWAIGIRHSRTIVTGEQEGSCPSTPSSIEAWSILGFRVSESEPWDPYREGVFRWEEYSRTGEYGYREPRSVGDAPSLGAFKPSDPRLVHRLYEEDPREPERNLERYDVPLLMRFGTPIAQMAYIGFAFVVTMAAADAATSLLGGHPLGLAGVARTIAGMAGGLKLLSPFGISRYPMFGRNMSERALRRLEERIWRDVKRQLEFMRARAMASRDDPKMKATLESIKDFFNVDRELRRAGRWKRVSRFFGGPGRLAWWVYNRARHGDPDRRIEFLERRRMEVLSRLLPDQAVFLQELSNWRSGTRMTVEEAQALMSRIKDQAKAQLGRGWFLFPLALLAHREGWVTLASSLVGRAGGKVTRGWALMGYDSPLAYRKLGIDWLRVGDRRLPVPREKGSFVGRGFVYGFENRKVALSKELVPPGELPSWTWEKLDEGGSRREELRAEVFGDKFATRELGFSEIRMALEGREQKELPVWRAEHVPEEGPKHSILEIRNHPLWNDPEIRFTRLESGEVREIDGTTIERMRLSEFFPAGEGEEAERALRELAREKTFGRGDDWAWEGRLVSGGAITGHGENGGSRAGADTKDRIGELMERMDLRSGIETSRREAEEASRGASEASGRSRRGRGSGIWGDEG